MVVDDAEQVIRADLSAGEELLWSGQPYQGILFRPPDVFVIPTSIIWTVAVLANALPAIMRMDRSEVIFMLPPAIPFTLVALFLLVGRFILDIYIRSHTYLAVTTRRVLIAYTGTFRTTTSITLETVSNIFLTEWSEDRGTIKFERGLWFVDFTRRVRRTNFLGANIPVDIFEGIPEATAVHRLICKVQRQRSNDGKIPLPKPHLIEL